MKALSQAFGTFALTTLLCTISLPAQAQTVVLTGRQIRGSVMSPAKLISEEVTLNRAYRVTSVETTGDGFWFERDGQPWKAIDARVRVKGTILPPGTYRVFPNLRNGQNEARVRVTLR